MSKTTRSSRAKGKLFEDLVRQVEEVLAPAGATITAPDYIPDVDTGRLREVDISIRAQIGSVPILILVECRDRGRKQDVTWVEDAASKRQSVRADKVVLVSRSGFSPEAVQKARARGVELRELEEATDSEVIAQWLPFQMLQIYGQQFRVRAVGVQFLLGEQSPPRQLQGKFPLDRFKLIQTGNPESWTVERLLLGHSAHLEPLWAQVPEDGRPLQYEVILCFRGGQVADADRLPRTATALEGTHVIDLPDIVQQAVLTPSLKTLDVGLLRLEVELWKEITEGPPHRMVQYSSADGSIMRSAFLETEWVQMAVHLPDGADTAFFQLSVADPKGAVEAAFSRELRRATPEEQRAFGRGRRKRASVHPPRGRRRPSA